MLIDTHSHLYLEDFSHDIDEIIDNCKQKNIYRIYMPSIEKKYTYNMIKLKYKYPDYIFLTIGVHPLYINKSNFEEQIDHVRSNIKNKNFVGVGEIGIDLHYTNKYLDIQQQAFKIQINLAVEYNMPIIIHSRNSFDQVLEVLDDFKSNNLKGIIHCFNGDEEYAYKFINKNMKLGIGGLITFKNNNMKNYISNIDIKNIVLETDSPYLSPHPLRGKRNDSSNITYICKFLSNIYNIHYNELSKMTTNNSLNIFKQI